MEVIRLNNVKIEEMAVSTVNELFLNHSNNISSHIKTDDKGISFDGNLNVYKSDQFTKESYLNSIPIQVKGSLVNHFSGQTIKYYEFDKNEFKNFQYEDGVGVFYVEIIKESTQNRKVFFKFLSAELLEEIRKYIKDNDTSQRLIELEELVPQANLDEKFREIAMQRKLNGLLKVKIDVFLKDSSKVIYTSEFEEELVTRGTKDIEKYEYKNLNSQYNINLRNVMKGLLSQDIIVDSFNLARVYGEIEKLNLLSVLPESNLKLAYLIKARYLAMTRNFESARATLQEFRNYYTDELQNEYEKVLIESNQDDNNIETLISKSFLSDSEKEKYLANYFLENDDLANFYEMFKDDSLKYAEWQYLYAQLLLRVENYKEAIEILYELNQNQPMISIEYDLIQARFIQYTNNLLFESKKRSKKCNNDLLNLLDDIEKIRQIVTKIDYIEMPGLEKLHFETKLLLNPEIGLQEIEGLLKNKETEDEIQFLIEWKIQLLSIINNNDFALNFINTLPSNQKNYNIIKLKLLIFLKKSAYKESIEYIEEIIIKELNLDDSEQFLKYLIQSYLMAASHYENIDVFEFDSFISEMINKYSIDLIILLQIEGTRKYIGSERYGESFGLIKEEFLNYPDSRKIPVIRDFLYRHNELNFAQQLYNDLALIDQEKADEILAALYLNNDKYKEALEIVNNYNDFELNELLIIIKAKILNALEQYSLTVQLYKNVDLANHEFLNQVLVAKIILLDREELEIIIKHGLESNDINFELNAAAALIDFGINLPLGVQLIEKYILKDQFNNTALNNNFFGLNVFNVKRFENNNLINMYHESYLKWYKFKRNESVREFIIVPEGWQVENFDGLEFHETNSDFKLLVHGLSTGDRVELGGEEYSLVDEKTLSHFIFQEIINRESGEPGTHKLLTSIKINPEDGGIQNLVAAIESFSNSDKFEMAQEQYEKFHFPSVYGAVIPKDDMLELFLELFHNEDSKYYIGLEEEYNPDSNYLISMSSMTFLAGLNLLDILKEYLNVSMEKTQQSWLENKFNKEIESTKAGRLNLENDGKLILNKKTQHQEKELREIYRNMVVASKSLNLKDLGFINEELKEFIRFDVTSIQVAIDEKMTLVCEDEALQIILESEFDIQVSSIGSLISHYYLEIEKDVDAFLDLLIRVIELKSAWILQKSTIEKLHSLVVHSFDSVITDKLNNWHKLYQEYYGIPSK